MLTALLSEWTWPVAPAILSYFCSFFSKLFSSLFLSDFCFYFLSLKKITYSGLHFLGATTMMEAETGGDERRCFNIMDVVFLHGGVARGNAHPPGNEYVSDGYRREHKKRTPLSFTTTIVLWQWQYLPWARILKFFPHIFS